MATQTLSDAAELIRDRAEPLQAEQALRVDGLRGCGQALVQPVGGGLGRQVEHLAHGTQVGAASDQSGWGVAQHIGLQALGDLVEIVVEQPQVFAIGHDGLFERLLVFEPETVRALELENAAAGFGAGSRLTGFGWRGDDLCESGPALAGGFEEIFEVGQAIGPGHRPPRAGQAQGHH